jgi:cytochrome c553
MRQTTLKNQSYPGFFLFIGFLLVTTPFGASAVKSTGTCPKEVMGGSHMGMNHSKEDMSQMSMNSPAAKLADSECVNCHGVHGISHSKDVPNLAGQNELYLCEWLVACHEEGGKCESHEDVAGKLSEEDILGLSDFYASMPSFSK